MASLGPSASAKEWWRLRAAGVPTFRNWARGDERERRHVRRALTAAEHLALAARYHALAAAACRRVAELYEVEAPRSARSR